MFCLAPLKFGDIKTTTPQIENQGAKDRIRVAPQNRRKPSRYRTSGNGAPPKPARSASSFSFKEDSTFLSKIDEDSDNFASNTSRHNSSNSNVSRHASNASRGSGRESLPPSSTRSNFDSARQDSFDNDSPSYQGSSDHVPRALVNKHSFSTADSYESRKERSIAQRSYSTNSRENVNRPKLPPVKPPRSAHTSTHSLDNDDVPVKKLSLGELKNKLFYSESFGKNDEKQQLSREDVFGSRGSIEKVEESKRYSYGDKRSSIGDETRLSKGSSRTSVSTADKRNSIDEKRNSYGASFRLSNGKISSTTIDDSTRSREDISSRHAENKEDKKELVFRKDDDGDYSSGMLAMALTSPRQDRKIEPQQEEQTNMLRSKSLSEKLENQHRIDNNFANGSKSVGHVNKPSVSPRKPVVTSEKSDDGPLEFRRVSLRTVPKKEDYLESENTDIATTTTNINNDKKECGDIFEFINSEMNLIDDKPTTTANSVSPFKTPSRVNKSFNEQPKQVVKAEEEVVTNSMAFTRSSVNNIDLNTNVKSSGNRSSFVSDDEKPKSSSWKGSSNSFEKSFDNEMSNKRHSLKSLDRGTSLDQQSKQQSSNDSLNSFEMKRHSLKKVDRYSSSSSTSIEKSGEQKNDFEFKRNSFKKLDSPLQQRETSSNDVVSEERAPRPLTKHRPTVHGGTSNKDFSFQSSDVARSKSLRLNEEKKTNENESESVENESKSSEPEWFKLARKKQKTEDEANQATPTKEVNLIILLLRE